MSPLKKYKFVVYRSAFDRQWYFHILASNGRVIAQSEGYKRRFGAVSTCESIRSHATRIEVKE